MKKTKIVCTVGPASDTKEVLTALVENGLNVMRLNFSHGSHPEQKAKIDIMREVIKETGKRVAILLDTKGPEIRTMTLEGGKDVMLKAGQEFTFTTDQTVVGDTTKVAVTYEGFAKDLQAGNTILLDDGLIELEVKETTDTEVKCTVINSGELGEKKGVNLPGVSVKLPALAEKDINDLKFGCEQGVDFVAASFIRKASDVKEVRDVLDANGGENIHIISKIENQEGIDNFDEILELSDGIMVARGDLGVEIPVQNVPFAQKMMIEKCNDAGKVVITATQMLDSMIRNPRPTRAEAGDVANAILDGTDAVMLSGETAKGKYPVVAVKTMAEICEKTDAEMAGYGMLPHEDLMDLTRTEAIAEGAVRTAEILGAKALIALTASGETARNMRKLFPSPFIIAPTVDETVANQLMLVRGVYPLVTEDVKSFEEFNEKALEIAVNTDYISDGDTVVITSGNHTEAHTTDSMRVLTVKK
jgi:pyruvate kinase